MIYERSPFSFKPNVVVIYSLFRVLSACFDWEKCIYRNNFFKPCTWRVKDADTQSHDIINDALRSQPRNLSPHNRNLTHVVTPRTVRLNSFYFCRKVRSQHLSSLHRGSLQPTAVATVRTDGRKKAVLARTVIRHRAGRKKHGRHDT